MNNFLSSAKYATNMGTLPKNARRQKLLLLLMRTRKNNGRKFRENLVMVIIGLCPFLLLLQVLCMAGLNPHSKPPKSLNRLRLPQKRTTLNYNPIWRIVMRIPTLLFSVMVRPTRSLL
jgi:hypothetical protein